MEFKSIYIMGFLPGSAGWNHGYPRRNFVRGAPRSFQTVRGPSPSVRPHTVVSGPSAEKVLHTHTHVPAFLSPVKAVVSVRTHTFNTLYEYLLIIILERAYIAVVSLRCILYTIYIYICIVCVCIISRVGLIDRAIFSSDLPRRRSSPHCLRRPVLRGDLSAICPL